MIPLLICYILKRFHIIVISEENLLKIKSAIQRMLLLALLMILTASFAANNPDRVTLKVFHIIKNDKVIGTIKIVKQVFGDSIIYELDSEINVKMLLTFNIAGKEKSVFNNGVLINSSVRRELNNKVKVNHNVELHGNDYILKEDNREEVLNIESIEQNLVTLYFHEPKGIKAIFCDNQKEMTPITCLGEGIYKVQIDKGKYNIFYYANGKCVKVQAVSPMFDVVLKPF